MAMGSRVKWFTGLLLALALIAVRPAESQSGGRGVIREGNLAGAEGSGPYNPLLCANAACARLNGLLFPLLLAVDPITGTFTPGTADNNGLAVAWEIVGERQLEVSLRDDAIWSDGTPITAYDVLYSYLAVGSDVIDSPYTDRVNASITGMVATSDLTLTIFTQDTTCGTLSIANLPIVPAHAFEPGFRESARTLTDGVFLPDAAAALRVSRNFRFMRSHPFNRTPSVTGGLFTFRELRPREAILLQTSDGTQGFAFVDMPDSETRVNRFLDGDLNLLVNPPLNRREEIRARDDVQVYSAPRSSWDGILFNLADPRQPVSAFVDGVPVEQGVHPIFGDVRVRRAVQMAIDVPYIIATVFKGEATQITGYQIPGTWAHNPDLQPVAYDPIGAGQLLDQAGWRLPDRFRARVCNGCTTAQPEAPLFFTLAVDSRFNYLDTVANLVAEQLTLVGFSVNVTGIDPSAPNNPVIAQRFDAFLGITVETYPANPDARDRFSTAGDVVGGFGNSGSYSNPEVDRLLDEARTAGECNPAARAPLYHEVQALLYDDQPYAWLYAPHEFVAVGPDVLGFAPYPNAPLWNIRAWVVFGE